MTTPDEDALEHLVLEEELDLQLMLLKDHTPPPTMFSESAPMEELPHLQDTWETSKLEAAVHNAEVELALEETVLGEAAMEMMAMCAVVALLALAPQFI